MFEKLRTSKLMFWSLELLVLALLVFVCTQISFLFTPIGIFVQTVFLPIIISGFLYYLLNPVVKLLQKVKIKKFRIPRTLAVAIVMIAVIALLALVIITVVPQLINQVSRLLANLPKFTNDVQNEVNDLMHNKWLAKSGLKVDASTIENSAGKYAKTFLLGTANGLGAVIGKVTSITITAITVPVMLFYMLNDGHKFMPNVMRLFPADKQDNIAELMGKMSKTISQYIDGQVLECLFVGVFTSIGYLIIGQPYALLLGVVAGITNIIPYVGPYIGIFPSLLVALTVGSWQLVWVIAVVVIVQQVDGNLIYPNIIGKTLKIHPLTIIIILLAAGNIAGIGGMILAIPLYAVVRTFVSYMWNIYRIQKGHITVDDLKDIE
ncbi:AI-2E family transporter [Periweissella cryptocerci]|uniref:AI-2E family transporter n=1 Tax=Periweissella cryptocerci TaxID=2506420 RepID=A0A4P6YUI4_9LACO|nr:AI-2E family transporter [Periweissella cryptocerci]QBO36438.1 AI-2E family transporter [Periweissella cryptocerci]